MKKDIVHKDTNNVGGLTNTVLAVVIAAILALTVLSLFDIYQEFTKHTLTQKAQRLEDTQIVLPRESLSEDLPVSVD